MKAIRKPLVRNKKRIGGGGNMTFFTEEFAWVIQGKQWDEQHSLSGEMSLNTLADLWASAQIRQYAHGIVTMPRDNNTPEQKQPNI